jgi:hypothetical protein
MAKIDPEAERKRLVEFYSQQMDGELEQVAGQAYELTDLARESLRAEMAHRGLSAAFVEHAPVAPDPPARPGDPPPELPRAAPLQGGELELQEMATIRKFRDLPEALFAKGSLESAGIECAMLDDNMVRLDWFISNLLGGVKLQVRAEDASIAEEILSQPIPENFDVTGIGEYEQPRCPKCHSLDVNFREVTPAAYVSAYVNMPIPFHRRAWRCHSCDAEWEDNGVDATPESTA